MELRVLQYFLMVAREENITRAAQQLHITQPTLSRQLAQLERELGAKLFTRSSHNIVLTSEGVLLKRRAQELLALADKTVKEVAHEEDSLAGEVAVGCGEFLSVGELAEIMTDFRRKYPLVSFDMHSGNVAGIKRRMEAGELDVGLVGEPVDVRTYEFVRMGRKEEWGVLVREDSPLADNATVTPDDLAEIPLIVSKSEAARNALAGWFGNRAPDMDVACTYNLLYNGAILVRAGMGVAVGLRLDGRYDGLRFVPLAQSFDMGTMLIWKEHQAFSPVTAAFIQFVKKRTSNRQGAPSET